MTDRTGGAASPRAPTLDESLTRANLEQALRDEAVAAVECAYFARIAEIEGDPEGAKALRELTEQHQWNAKGSLDLLMRARCPLSGKLLGETRQNVAALAAFAAGDANVEQGRANTARNEGFSDIGSWFESIGRLREVHGARLATLARERKA